MIEAVTERMAELRSIKNGVPENVAFASSTVTNVWAGNPLSGRKGLCSYWLEKHDFHSWGIATRAIDKREARHIHQMHAQEYRG